jgi:PAS domain S-box-containing protein
MHSSGEANGSHGVVTKLAERARQSGTKAFPLHRFNIGARLTICFVLIIVAMLAGNAVLLWEFYLGRQQAERLGGVDQELIAVLQAHTHLMSSYERLDVLARSENPIVLAQEAETLQGVLIETGQRTTNTLSRLPQQVQLDPTLLPTLAAIQDELSSQLEAITALAKSGDWEIVRFRLAKQVRALETRSATLVQSVDREVAEERGQALLNIAQAQRRIVLITPMTALLTLLFAGLLGLVITRSITQPLGRLVEGSTALAKGDFSHRVPTIGNDEIARLGSVFNEMVVRLQELYRELQRRETYLAEAQKISHTGSFGWDVLTGVIFWSQETFRIFEYEPTSKITVEMVLQRTHPEDRPAVQQVIENASREGTEFDLEHRLLMPNGAVKYLHVIGRPSESKNGSLEFVGAVTDITERKLAGETLRQSEARLAEAQRLSHAGSWAWNKVSNHTYWSEETFRIYGFPPETTPSRELFLQRVHPDDRETVEAAADALLADDHAVCDFRLVLPDHSLKYVHSVAQALRDQTGDVVEFVGTVIDITDRKRAEEELQQLVDFVPQIIVVLSPDGQITHANRVAREYTGLTLDEYRSVDVLGRVIHPDDVESMRSIRERGVSANSPFEIEARTRRKDGVYRWFLYRYSPWTEQGVVKRWYATGTEIESRKQEEVRVRQENVRLEERTRIAQELHDTLLQSFLGASMQLGAAMNTLPSGSLVKPKLDQIVELMEQGIEEARNTIEGLRSFDPRTSDLAMALSEVKHELAVAPEIDFFIRIVGRQQLLQPPIRQEIYRIGREALANAFFHSKAKRVECELEYTDSDVSIRIRDNGCGIDAQVLSAGREGHWGLAGMRERAARIGGLLKISSSATAGTEVQLSVPSGVAFQPSPASAARQDLC